MWYLPLLSSSTTSAFNKHKWWIKTLASSLFREVTYVPSFPVVTHSTCTVYFNLIFINRLRWDAYLHMYMLFLVENLYKNSFLQLAHLLSFLMLFIAVNSPNFVYQEGGCEDSKESPTIFTETVRCRSSFFLTRQFFYFLCWRSIFVLKAILILPIYSPYLSSFLPQRRFLFCYTEGVAKI